MSVPKNISAADRDEYNRGWAASQRYARSAGLTSPLENPHTDAWIDGYMDYAIGRDKWHLFTCENHQSGAGGCGQA